MTGAIVTSPFDVVKVSWVCRADQTQRPQSRIPACAELWSSGTPE
jgi:hypothetical protein